MCPPRFTPAGSAALPHKICAKWVIKRFFGQKARGFSGLAEVAVILSNFLPSQSDMTMFVDSQRFPFNGNSIVAVIIRPIGGIRHYAAKTIQTAQRIITSNAMSKKSAVSRTRITALTCGVLAANIVSDFMNPAMPCHIAAVNQMIRHFIINARARTGDAG